MYLCDYNIWSSPIQLDQPHAFYVEAEYKTEDGSCGKLSVYVLISRFMYVDVMYLTFWYEISSYHIHSMYYMYLSMPAKRYVIITKENGLKLPYWSWIWCA